MGKNKKFLQSIIKKNEEEWDEIITQVSKFNDIEAVKNNAIAWDRESFFKFLKTYKMPKKDQNTNEKMEQMCLEIRDNVKACKKNNIEIDFLNCTQKYDGKSLPLGDTLVKICTYDDEHAIQYLFLKSGEKINCLAFLGGSDCQAILCIDDGKGGDKFIRLSELHLLSIGQNSDSKKEVGLMTSFTWFTAQVFTSIVIGSNLYPIKNLILADGLRACNTKDLVKAEVNEIGAKKE